MTKIVLSQQEICRLYDRGDKSLEEIGQIAKVSGTRIGQLLNEWGHPKRRRKPPRKDKFTDLDLYLEHCEKTGQRTHSLLLRLLKPLLKPHLKRCGNCGAIRNLRFKYRRWPIKSLRDVRVLCPSCLLAVAKGRGLDGLKRREIFWRFTTETSVSDLAQEFGVTKGRIYQVIWAERKRRKAVGCFP